MEARRGEDVELGAEEGVETLGGEAGEEEPVEPERERRAEVGARPPREGDEVREGRRRRCAEEEVEESVRAAAVAAPVSACTRPKRPAARWPSSVASGMASLRRRRRLLGE